MLVMDTDVERVLNRNMSLSFDWIMKHMSRIEKQSKGSIFISFKLK